jgi:hypothetical protein
MEAVDADDLARDLRDWGDEAVSIANRPADAAFRRFLACFPALETCPGQVALNRSKSKRN